MIMLGASVARIDELIALAHDITAHEGQWHPEVPLGSSPMAAAGANRIPLLALMLSTHLFLLDDTDGLLVIAFKLHYDIDFITTELDYDSSARFPLT